MIDGINPSGFVQWMKKYQIKDFERLCKKYLHHRLKEEIEHLNAQKVDDRI